jgi:hypothetical protein
LGCSGDTTAAAAVVDALSAAFAQMLLWLLRCWDKQVKKTKLTKIAWWPGIVSHDVPLALMVALLQLQLEDAHPSKSLC